MAAGQGFKTFTTGEVLTAGDVNGYLMQGVLVFASAAARDAAITSPQEGQFAFTKDTNGLWYYDGAAWVASGATGDIEGVTAGIGISGGGTSGTVTVTNSMATAIDAKGDLVAGTGADTFAKLTVGANDTVLTADSTTATGLKWATPSSGASFVGASVYKTAVQSIANNTNAALTFTNENFDTNSIHDNSTNTSRFTIPSGKDGKWLFTGIVTWGSNTTGYREIKIRKNNTASTEVYNIMGPPSVAASPSMGVSYIADAVATDYFELYVKQTSGGSLNVEGDATFTNYTIFQCVYLGA